MNDKKDNINFKVILLGDSNVGKTSLLLRYTDDIFYDSQVSTLGIDFRKKTLEREDIIVKMQLWDTAGQERFRCSIPKDFYKNANGILILYDITSRESFSNVKNWIENIDDSSKKSMGMILVGNKSDRLDSRKVLLSEGQEISVKYGIPFFETSCKLNLSINEVFNKLIDKMLEFSRTSNRSSEIQSVKLNYKSKKQNGGGCC